jgi:putative transcriptional regulator
MIVYKEIIEKLRESGYNTNRLRKEKLLSESVIQAIRENKPITTTTINAICEMLRCQPGDILEYADKPGIIEIIEEERYGLILRYVGDGWKIDGYSEVHPTFIIAEKAAEKIAKEQ